jgi:hypothetical protein
MTAALAARLRAVFQMHRMRAPGPRPSRSAGRHRPGHWQARAAIGYLVGADIMLIGGPVEVFLGVQAGGKSLEQVTKPLTSVSDLPAATAATAEPTAA